MKVKAAFIDKFTKKEYKKGDSYTHADDERTIFLAEKGFLEAPKKVAPKSDPKKETPKKTKK